MRNLVQTKRLAKLHLTAEQVVQSRIQIIAQALHLLEHRFHNVERILSSDDSQVLLHGHYVRHLSKLNSDRTRLKRDYDALLLELQKTKKRRVKFERSARALGEKEQSENTLKDLLEHLAVSQR